MSAGSINLVAPEAEERLLSSCLDSTAALMAAVGSGLRPEDFGTPGHETIYRAMRDMMDRGQSVDATTLSGYLESCGKLDLIGGKGVIDRLAALDGTAHNVSDYSEIVRDRSIRRRMFDVTEDIVNMVHSEPSVRELISTSENLIYRVADRLSGGAKDGMTAADLVDLYRNRSKQVEKIPYPFQTMREESVGRERGSLTVWGGYSSDGKSIVGLQSAIAAAEAGYNVGFISLEMTEEELLYRLLAMLSGVEKQKIETADMTLDEDAKVGQAIHKLSQLPITTYHDPDYTPADIRMLAKREDHDHMVIDYLQRLPWSDWKDIPGIAKQFKNMALSTRVSIDLLSQLTPAQIKPGENPFTYPTLNSLYGGKATAHEANNVVFVYAERAMNEMTGKWERTGLGKISIAKQRGGKAEYDFDVRFNEKRIMWEEPASDNLFYLPTANT